LPDFALGDDGDGRIGAKRRERSDAVRTSTGLVSRPVPATMNPRGTVIAKSMLPYSR